MSVVGGDGSVEVSDVARPVLCSLYCLPAPECYYSMQLRELPRPECRMPHHPLQKPETQKQKHRSLKHRSRSTILKLEWL